jgi:hypothetical protein
MFLSFFLSFCQLTVLNRRRAHRAALRYARLNARLNALGIKTNPTDTAAIWHILFPPLTSAAVGNSGRVMS